MYFLLNIANFKYGQVPDPVAVSARNVNTNHTDSLGVCACSSPNFYNWRLNMTTGYFLIILNH